MLLAKSILRGFRPRISPHTPPGSAPGTIVSDPEAPPPVIRVMAYSADTVEEKVVDDLREIADFMDNWPVTWVNVDGLGDAETLRALGELFDLHSLALEDVASTNQRPKLEVHDEHLFMVIRMPQLADGGTRTEQVCVFLMQKLVVTFQERAGDCFDPVRRRIRSSRARFMDAGYLAYSLLDAIVDSFFPILEAISEHLESIEEEITVKPRPEVLGSIFSARHDLLSLRRAIWPMRDVLNELIRDEVPYVSDSVRMYLRDCYDHALRIVDLVESYRELNAGLMEYYASSIGHRMNEVMKVLTIIATIFIPMTLIAGIYGMNFNAGVSPLNMPELNWYWGYPIALAGMACVAVAMLVYFRRKRWI